MYHKVCILLLQVEMHADHVFYDRATRSTSPVQNFIITPSENELVEKIARKSAVRIQRKKGERDK